MSAPLIIIGSGFAAYQLVKTLRRKKSDIPIAIFTAGNGDEYNKPDLSHVFTRQQDADELISHSGAEFAKQHNVQLFANTRVDSIDTQSRTIVADGISYTYSSLVLATGAQTFVPQLEGDATNEIITLNSLEEYRHSQQRIHNAKRVVIMGGGLIGTELAMDLCAIGKKVHIVEPGSQLMANILPAFVAAPIEHQLRLEGVEIECHSYAKSITRSDDSLQIATNKGLIYHADCVISAAGLTPNINLAKLAGLETNRGIVVDEQLRSSVEHIYAIGDCAEINGRVRAYLQPIILSANTLASTLLSEPASLTMPAMMIKVKTPSYPIQLGGTFDKDSQWKIELSTQGIKAKAYDQQQRLTGFVVTNDNINQAFPLLREVQTG